MAFYFQGIPEQGFSDKNALTGQANRLNGVEGGNGRLQELDLSENRKPVTSIVICMFRASP